MNLECEYVCIENTIKQTKRNKQKIILIVNVNKTQKIEILDHERNMQQIE